LIPVGACPALQSVGSAKRAVAVPAFPPIERFVTGVVEVTTNGAVPVASVEVN
jgi:hypothetical protein